MSTFYRIITLSLIGIFACQLNTSAQDQPQLRVGGILSFNYFDASEQGIQQRRAGDFGYDFFAITADASYKDIEMHLEYRLYQEVFGGNSLRYGYLAYDLDEYSNLQLGLMQQPWDIGDYNSYSYLFTLSYFLGMEDDYDMGIKYTYKRENWLFALAFFKNSEELSFSDSNDASLSRYSFDVVSYTDENTGISYRNKETNQFSAHAVYSFGDEGYHKLGFSGRMGQLDNLNTGDMGYHYAFGLLYNYDRGPWGVKAMASLYRYDAEHEDGVDPKFIGFGGLGTSFLLASKGQLYTSTVGYKIPVDWGPIDEMRIFSEFSYLHKEFGFEGSFLHTTGVNLFAGNLGIYPEFSYGKNVSLIGGDPSTAFAQGDVGSSLTYTFLVNLFYTF